MSSLPAVLCALLAASAPAAPVPDVLGTYRVRADVRLSGIPLVSSLELRGDVVVKAGARPSRLTVKLSSRGHTCLLEGDAAARAGELTLAAGQRCTVVLEEPEARGRVVAEVRGGRLRVDAAGRLTLALEVRLTGSVRVATGLAGVPGLGGDAEVPTNGEARVEGTGERDNSRAAE